MDTKQEAEQCTLESAQHCIVCVGGCPILHSIDKCPIALYSAIQNIFIIERQLYDSGQVSLMDSCHLA